MRRTPQASLDVTWTCPLAVHRHSPPKSTSAWSKDRPQPLNRAPTSGRATSSRVLLYPKPHPPLLPSPLPRTFVTARLTMLSLRLLATFHWLNFYSHLNKAANNLHSANTAQQHHLQLHKQISLQEDLSPETRLAWAHCDFSNELPTAPSGG